MKNIVANISLITLLFFLIQLQTLTQTDSSKSPIKFMIGLNAGYAGLNMEDVNQDLNDTYDFLRSANINITKPEDVGGGLMLDGALVLNISDFLIGVGASYISGNGNISYSDFTGSIEENYDMQALELMGVVGVILPISEIVSFDIRGYAGYGRAKVDYLGDIAIFDSPGDSFHDLGEVSGNYFAGRFQGGLNFSVGSIMLTTAVGYRIADAGELKGEVSRNGNSIDDIPISNIRGSGIEFDYSGVFFLGGIGIIL